MMLLQFKTFKKSCRTDASLHKNLFLRTLPICYLINWLTINQMEELKLIDNLIRLINTDWFEAIFYIVCKLYDFYSRFKFQYWACIYMKYIWMKHFWIIYLTFTLTSYYYQAIKRILTTVIIHIRIDRDLLFFKQTIPEKKGSLPKHVTRLSLEALD